MLRCDLVESDDAAMARFRGGLNREIQDILDYKDYFDITTLFEYACKAEREVQGRRSKKYTNSFAGRGPTHSSTPFSPHLLRLALHRAQGQPSQWRSLPKAPLLP